MPDKDKSAKHNLPSDGKQTFPETVKLTRYKMMEMLRNQKPITEKEFLKILKGHYVFIKEGGCGGKWQTVVTEGGEEGGIILGIYLDKEKREYKIDELNIPENKSKRKVAKQARFYHENLTALNLKNVITNVIKKIGNLTRIALP